MNVTTEVTKIIQYAMSGDKGRVESYARLVAENLLKEGDERSHNRVMKSLEPDNEQYSSGEVSLDKVEILSLEQITAIIYNEYEYEYGSKEKCRYRAEAAAQKILETYALWASGEASSEGKPAPMGTGIEKICTINFKNGEVIKCGLSKIQEAEETFGVLSGIRVNDKGEWVAFFGWEGSKHDVASFNIED